MARKRTKGKAKVKRAAQREKAVSAANGMHATEKPTPEMLARAQFEFGPVMTEMNVRIGAAYRRIPLYLTMAKKADRFTFEELDAMRLYRSVFDRCERSPMACALAAGGSFGRNVTPASFIHASPGVVEAKRKLGILERGLGHALGTMRDVILHDKSFSTIAMERFGYRTRSWIITDEPVTANGHPVMADGKPLKRAV